MVPFVAVVSSDMPSAQLDTELSVTIDAAPLILIPLPQSVIMLLLITVQALPLVK